MEISSGIVQIKIETRVCVLSIENVIIVSYISMTTKENSVLL